MWYELFTDSSIMSVVNTCITDYKIASGLILSAIWFVVRRTRTKVDDRILERLTKVLGLPAEKKGK